MDLILSIGMANGHKTFGEALDFHLEALHKDGFLPPCEQDKTVVYVMKKYANSPIARSDSIEELYNSYVAFTKANGYGSGMNWEGAIQAGDWPVTIPV